MTDTEISSSLTWRNEELKSTDWIIQVSDHPERPLYYTYNNKIIII